MSWAVIWKFFKTHKWTILMIVVALVIGAIAGYEVGAILLAVVVLGIGALGLGIGLGVGLGLRYH